MKNKILLIILVFSVALNIAAGVSLCYHWLRAKRVFGPPPFWEGISKCEKLPPHERDEREWIHNLRQEALPGVMALRDSLELQREKLIRLLQSPEPDSVEIEQTYNRMTELRTAIERRIFEAIKRKTRDLPPEARARILNNLGRRLGGRAWGHKMKERRER